MPFFFLDSTTETSTPALSSTPHKRSYPWLDNLSDDEQGPVSLVQTGLSSCEKPQHSVDPEDQELSFAEVQKSLKSEFDSEARLSFESCDDGGGSCDTGVESCDISVTNEICQSGTGAVSGNPDEIALDEENEEEMEGGLESKPMTTHSAVGGQDTQGVERRILNLPQPKGLALSATQEEKPDESQMGGVCDEATEMGSKVVKKSPVIKRRNLAMYQSTDDETS